MSGLNIEHFVIERAIARSVVSCLLSAGYTVTVNDGEEDVATAKDGYTPQAYKYLVDAMFSTDEDVIYVDKEGYDSPHDYFVQLIYGNGIDVISNYSTPLQDTLKAATDFVDELEIHPERFTLRRL